MKSRSRSLVAVLFVVSLAGMILQWNVNQDLKERNNFLRARVTEEERHGDPSALLVRELRTNIDKLRRENAEIPKLKDELQKLQVHTIQLEHFKTAEAQLPVLDAHKSSQVSLSNAVLQINIPKSAWTNRGFATPAAAAETILWAGRENRVDVFLNAFVPELRQEMERQIHETGTPDATGQIADARTLRILAEIPISDSEVELAYIVDGWNENRVFVQPMQKSINGWKISAAPR